MEGDNVLQAFLPHPAEDLCRLVLQLPLIPTYGIATSRRNESGCIIKL